MANLETALASINITTLQQDQSDQEVWLEDFLAERDKLLDGGAAGPESCKVSKPQKTHETT